MSKDNHVDTLSCRCCKSVYATTSNGYSASNWAMFMVSSKSLSPETLTKLYLIKHHLLKKAKKTDLVTVIGDVCGLHAQAATTPYLSLWNRVEDFEGALLDEALYKAKSLVKTWVMRGTLHLIPSADLPIYNRALRRMWFEHHGRFMRAPDWPSKEERGNVIYPMILEALAQKPLKRKDLNDKVRSLLKVDSQPYKKLFSSWGGILKETAYEGLTVCAQPAERESCFARLDKWLPHTDLNKVSEEEAHEKLLVKYLRGYGPATQQDFCLWSGLTASDAKEAIENAGSITEEVKVEGAKGVFLLLKQDFRLLGSIDVDEKAPPCLLPRYDSFLLGHKDRTRIISDEHRQRVFKSKAGDIAATVLVNGRIVGTWRYKKTKRMLTIMITPFEKIAKEDLKEIEHKAKGLSQYMGTEDCKLSIVS